MAGKKFVLQALALAAFAVAASTAHAQIQVYTTAASFAAATVLPGTDSFDDLPVSGGYNLPAPRPAGVYSYTVAASSSTFYAAGLGTDRWLSTNLAGDSVLFNGFSGGTQGGIRAIGGNFFGSDVNGAYLLGDVTLRVTDSLGQSQEQTITGATVSSFIGFRTTGFITSLTLSAVQTATPLWPTANNLVLAIPEPGTYALMLAGLAAVGVVARRRKA